MCPKTNIGILVEKLFYLKETWFNIKQLGHIQVPDKICGICGFASKQTQKLEMYIKSIHEKIKDNVCTTCAFATSDPVNLKRRIFRVHVHDKIKDKIKYV